MASSWGPELEVFSFLLQETLGSVQQSKYNQISLRVQLRVRVGAGDKVEADKAVGVGVTQQLRQWGCSVPAPTGQQPTSLVGLSAGSWAESVPPCSDLPQFILRLLSFCWRERSAWNGNVFLSSGWAYSFCSSAVLLTAWKLQNFAQQWSRISAGWVREARGGSESFPLTTILYFVFLSLSHLGTKFEGQQTPRL